MKNIVVIGGGTAGWLTALAAKKRYPFDNVVVIASKEIGILGAGEGSTPNLVLFLVSLGISVEELIKKTKSTIKLGIKFNNFSNESDYYYHSFALNNLNLKINQILLRNKEQKNMPIFDLIAMSNGMNQNQFKISAMALDKNKIPFVQKSEKSERILDFDVYNQYSIHFDARLLAQFLEDKAISRGIKHIDDKIKNFTLDNNGNISSINLYNDNSVDADFVFDASGFSRLTNKNIFNTEWVSFSENLPAKKAIPFFLDIDQNNIPAYTESTAMNYGWMWKIPLQHRYGCGYVFDSDFISEDEAKLEVERFLGHSIESPKTFAFNPGYYKTIWNKNSIAVGLSGGFVEPLEATSIMQTVKVLEFVFRFDYDIFKINKHHVKELNKMYEKHCKEIRDFLYLHYMTNKTNTIFWKNFTNNNKIPDTLSNTLDCVNKYTNHVDEESIFLNISWYVVMHGNKILNTDFLNIFKNLQSESFKDFEEVILKRKVLSDFFIDHSEFLKRMGGLNETI